MCQNISYEPTVSSSLTPFGECLHCSLPPVDNDSVQVACDDCSSFICNVCHWCHEYQANHEIRVCDRCDAFYCRSCDEMDQCEDCNEVVCGNCSTLMSCKFCGCGLCEDCATACGRCGIVLCARDAKFAVECDTCRMPYCLVCLASGNKDPCVRCGHRPSKRVEQLVHLRLKSIYKAFKQSGAALEGGKKDADNTNRKDDSPPDLSLTGDVGAVLQAAAAAAHTNCQSNLDECHESNANHEQGRVPGKRILEAERRRINNLSHEKRNPIKEKNNDDAQQIFSRTQAEADAAAAALLAEIDLEEEKRPTGKSNKKKKKKKKSKTTNQFGSNKKNNDSTSKSKTTQISPPMVNTPSSPISSSSSAPHENEIDEDDIILNFHQSRSHNKSDVDNSVESKLTQLISNADIEGIEKLLNMLRGVPGRAALRKNAKKALKKLKEVDEEQQRLRESKEGNQNKTSSETCSVSDTSSSFDNTTNSYKAPEPLLKLVSSKMKPNHKSECVMHMAPSVVGWVIGKGGQRIRDLMVDSGAKVWIDQDSMGSKEARIVYVSGGKTNVDCAVRMVKDLVAKAPVGNGIGNTVILKDFTKGSHFSPNSLPRSQSSPAPDNIDEQRSTISASVHTSFSNTKNGNLSITQQQQKTESTRLSSKPTSKFDNHNADIITEVITCEPMFVALLIGRRGWTVKHIQDASGAKVDIDQSVTPRIITVSGDKKSVQSAVKMVNDVLSYPHAQLRYGEKEDDVNSCFEQTALDMKSNRHGMLDNHGQTYSLDNQDFKEDDFRSNNLFLSSTNERFSSHIIDTSMDKNFADRSDQRYNRAKSLTSSNGHTVKAYMHDLENSANLIRQNDDKMFDDKSQRKDLLIEKKSQPLMNEAINARNHNLPNPVQESNLQQSLHQNCEFSSADLSQTSIALNSDAQVQETGYLDFSKNLPTETDNTINQIQGEALFSDNYNHSSGWTSGYNYLDPILPFQDHSESVNLRVGKSSSNPSSNIQIGSQLIGNESEHQQQQNLESSMIDLFASSAISQSNNLQSSQSTDTWGKSGSTIPGWGSGHAQDNINGIFGNNISNLWGGISLDLRDTGINEKETSNS